MPRLPVSFRRRSLAACAALCLAGILSGCAQPGASGDVPVEYREGAVRERPLPPGGLYTVQRGDTIYSIARQYNLTVRALIDANNLQPPYQLVVGQSLVLNSGSDYVVQKGDTLLGVAKRLGLSLSTLARMNNLPAPYVVKVGQRLKLPAKAGEGTQTAAAPPPPVAIEGPVAVQSSGPLPPPPPVAPPAAAGREQKDKGAVVAEALPPPPPPGEAPSQQQPGEVQLLPPPPAPPPSPPPSPVMAGPQPVPGGQPPGAPEGGEQKMAAAAPVPPPPARSRKGFLWPVHGPVIAEYGTTGKGQHNDGINIAVPRGTPVVAAEDGVVAYAGNELRGFGNLLLVKHADGWMTAYAHNDTLLVHRGDTVKRGQQIAKSGDSGGVGQPQVHFEVRRGTHAVDPMTFFKDRPGPLAVPADQPSPG